MSVSTLGGNFKRNCYYLRVSIKQYHGETTVLCKLFSHVVFVFKVLKSFDLLILRM